MSYGLTIASRGQDSLVQQLEGVLESYNSISVHRGEKKADGRRRRRLRGGGGRWLVGWRRRPNFLSSNFGPKTLILIV